ncbi:mCG1051087 [Mus musculus]|nr:mCG1051087 [Mus musculus]
MLKSSFVQKEHHLQRRKGSSEPRERLHCKLSVYILGSQ